jgi:hypothetical protein
MPEYQDRGGDGCEPRPRGIGANSRLVTDAEFEESLHWLRDNAEVIGRARGRKVVADELRKTVKARCMKKHPRLSVSGQEREAEADPEYERWLRNELEDAVAEDMTYTILTKYHDGRMMGWHKEQNVLLKANA